MGSEWSEEQAGPQGPPGPPGGTYLMSTVGGASSSSTVYSGTAEAMLPGAVVSADVLGGYRYRITLHLPIRSTVAGDVAIVRVKVGTTIAAPTARAHRVYLPTANVDYPADFYAVYDHVSGDVRQFFGVSVARLSGSGTLTVAVGPGELATLELQQLMTSSYGEF